MTRFGGGTARASAAAVLLGLAAATAGAQSGMGSASSGAQPNALGNARAASTAGAPAQRMQLDELLARLADTRDEQEASRLEDRIFELWSKSGDAGADSLFAQGLVALAYRDYARAEQLFGDATRRAPDFAEAWNKLASVHYLEGDLARSLREADHTLLLERRHYGALAGRGMVLAALGDESGALASFELALTVNPASPSLKRNVERLRNRLGYRSAE